MVLALAGLSTTTTIIRTLDLGEEGSVPRRAFWGEPWKKRRKVGAWPGVCQRRLWRRPHLGVGSLLRERNIWPQASGLRPQAAWPPISRRMVSGSRAMAVSRARAGASG